MLGVNAELLVKAIHKLTKMFDDSCGLVDWLVVNGVLRDSGVTAQFSDELKASVADVHFLNGEDYAHSTRASIK